MDVWLVATRVPCRTTDTVTSQRPAIEIEKGPLKTPGATGSRRASARIAGMFMLGMAGMVNRTRTSASDDSGDFPSLRWTSTMFSPVLGGLGIVWTVICKDDVSADLGDVPVPAS